jgi:hypothetical protein
MGRDQTRRAGDNEHSRHRRSTRSRAALRPIRLRQHQIRSTPDGRRRHPFGPRSSIGAGVHEADALGSTYAGCIHHISDDTIHFMAWNRADEAGAFVGDLTAPGRVAVHADGSLVVSDLVVS